MTDSSPVQRARQSLQRTLNWYSSFKRHGRRPPSPELQAIAQPQLKTIKNALEQLEHPIFRIAMFGLVSRGKSAVVNALLGQKRLLTSPLNGETRYPQAVQWQLVGQTVELIDTPGLDEIEGQIRADMARDVAAQADLILFVVAGDITRTEYQAIAELRATHKPLILVFNKIDLYPDVEQGMIYTQLAQLANQRAETPPPSPLPTNIPESKAPIVEDIVMIAAEPAPILIRNEWSDGSVSEEWETPAPIIAPLKAAIATVLTQAGESLIALNALVQAKSATQTLARDTIEQQRKAAETLIWRYAQGKAIAVAANPIAVVDLIGGMVSDLALIRALAKLYGLPMTSFAAERLWRKIIFSSVMLLFGEIGGGLVLGTAKTAGIATEGAYPWGTWSMAALLQGGLAGYGSLVIGKVAQRYLEQGCTWGDRGISPTIRNVINTVDAPQVMARLRQVLLDQ
ncbi:MAG: DUF697 domain-containing protein [Spirulina sp. SIO3F2]|nr:DUF697 domain-containing protein [Spirulina sp. SIO3F2]